MLTVDTELAQATCDDGGLTTERVHTGGSGSTGDDNPPVIDTTSAEVERKPDGKQASEYRFTNHVLRLEPTVESAKKHRTERTSSSRHFSLGSSNT